MLLHGDRLSTPRVFKKSRSKLASSWAEDWLFPSLASETRRCICRTHCTIFFSADTKGVFQFHNGTFTIHLTLEWSHSSSFTAHSLPPCGLFTSARVQPILRLPCRKTSIRCDALMRTRAGDTSDWFRLFGVQVRLFLMRLFVCSSCW